MKTILFFLMLTVPLFPELFAGIDFDGSDDIITVVSDATLEGFSSITLSAWIFAKAQAKVAEARIISKTNGAGGDDYSLMFTEFSTMNGIRLRITVSGTTTSMDFEDAGIALNTWYHYAGVYNGTDMRVYIDGILKGTPVSKTGTIQDSNKALTIGSHDDGPTDRQFTGIISEVSIWDTALSANEIKLLYSSKVKRMPLQIQPSNLQSYWPIDDAADGSNANGVTFKDLSGNGNDGVGNDGANNTGVTAKAEEILSY